MQQPAVTPPSSGAYRNNSQVFRRASAFLVDKKNQVPLHRRTTFYIFSIFSLVSIILCVTFFGSFMMTTASLNDYKEPSLESYKAAFPLFFHDECQVDSKFGCAPKITPAPTTESPTLSPSTSPTSYPTQSPTPSPTKFPTTPPVAPPL